MAESLLSHFGDFTIIDSSQSPLNGVIFHNVQTTYSTEEAVKCTYSITESIDPEVGDIIGLFKVGWVTPSEAHSSIPAKMPIDQERTFINTVFEVHQLPNDSTDLYQFCYVTKRGVVGASTPFTFESNDIVAVEDPADPGLLVFKSRVSQLKDELRKLSDEKSYYASKYEVLSDNFFKLKNEFHKLEEGLKFEREGTKKLDDSNKLLMYQIKMLKGQIANDNNDPNLESDAEPNEPMRDLGVEQMRTDLISAGTEAISGRINSDVWKSLYEIYEVAKEIDQSLKSSTGDEVKLSYKALIDFILEIFTETKRKFQMNDIGKIEEPHYCPCYYHQKAFSCPRLMNEEQFQFFMTQPLYTCFSNFSHLSEEAYKNCDGSFDPDSLTNYAQTISQTPEFLETKSESSKIDKSRNLASGDTNEPHSTINIIERKDHDEELKAAREKIAALVSRVDVLELELVAQKSNKLNKVENSNELSVPSSSCLKSSDIESILESVNNEYINVKEKCNELSKKIARSDSLETKCAILEEENKKLMSYLSQKSDENKPCELPIDIRNLIIEKEKTEQRLINLQKESVGKISVNLVNQENKNKKSRMQDEDEK